MGKRKTSIVIRCGMCAALVLAVLATCPVGRTQAQAVIVCVGGAWSDGSLGKSAPLWILEQARNPESLVSGTQDALSLDAVAEAVASGQQSRLVSLEPIGAECIKITVQASQAQTCLALCRQALIGLRACCIKERQNALEVVDAENSNPPSRVCDKAEKSLLQAVQRSVKAGGPQKLAPLLDLSYRRYEQAAIEKERILQLRIRRRAMVELECPDFAVISNPSLEMPRLRPGRFRASLALLLIFGMTWVVRDLSLEGKKASSGED